MRALTYWMGAVAHLPESDPMRRAAEEFAAGRGRRVEALAQLAPELSAAVDAEAWRVRVTRDEAGPVAELRLPEEWGEAALSRRRRIAASLALYLAAAQEVPVPWPARCEHCRRIFQPTSERARFCSESHRTMACRDRKRGES